MRSRILATVIVAAAFISALLPAFAADDLKLKHGVSFNQDLDTGFPILGSNLEDCKFAAGIPTLLFFGASGDLNTNRQAKRLVDLYRKLPEKSVKFIVIDVDHPANAEAKTLITSHYKGYIPCEVLFDKSGKQLWTHDGEVEFNLLKAQVDKAL